MTLLTSLYKLFLLGIYFKWDSPPSQHSWKFHHGTKVMETFPMIMNLNLQEVLQNGSMVVCWPPYHVTVFQLPRLIFVTTMPGGNRTDLLHILHLRLMLHCS